MSSVQTYIGTGMELSLSWCRKQWLHVDADRLSDTVIAAMSYLNLEKSKSRGGSASSVCVGRALRNSEWCPGYYYCQASGSMGPLFLASLDYCYRSDDFEILTNTSLPQLDGRPFEWQQWQGSKEVPENALVGGTRKGQPLYVARTKLDNAFIIGSFAPGLQMASFNYRMTLVQRNRDFDLLTMKRRVIPSKKGGSAGIR